MKENLINKELCTTCKLCMNVCPCNIIGMNDAGEVHFIPERKTVCISCVQCMAICSSEAIKINGFSYGKELLEFPESKIRYDEFLNFLSNRRSVRNFKEKAVSEEIINQILYSVSFAPYGAAPEEMNITVVNNRAIIEESLPHISIFLDNVVKWIENPIASFMIKRKKGAETFNTIKNHLYPIAKSGNYKPDKGDRITRGAPAIIIFHANKEAEEHSHNSLIYATYTMMAAQSLGLGATMNGIVPSAINKVKEVRKIFSIPEQNEAIMSVIIGYPKYKYKKAIVRNHHKVKIIN